MAHLGTTEVIPDEVLDGIENFICKVYLSGTKTRKLSTLRWHLFSHKNMQGEKLPPTKTALNPAIRRANLTCLVWQQDTIANPFIPSSLKEHGWEHENNTYEPIMCDSVCAPEILLNEYKCNCKKGGRRCANCSCKKRGIYCTELCGCFGNDEDCDNTPQDEELEYDEVE